MKKKILALCLVVVLAVTAVTGATLAYFTDAEKATNVMTIGNIDINLDEFTYADGDGNGTKEYIPFKPEYISLYPVSDDEGSVTANKYVRTKNTSPSKADAYIRTFVAVERFQDANNPSEKVTLFGIGWQNSTTTATKLADMEINGKWYNVWQLDPKGDGKFAYGEYFDSLTSVFVKSYVTQEQLKDFGVMVVNADGTVTANFDVLVLSQGIQTEGFDNYAEAMASFGEVNSENLSKWFGNAAPAVING